LISERKRNSAPELRKRKKSQEKKEETGEKEVRDLLKLSGRTKASWKMIRPNLRKARFRRERVQRILPQENS